MKRLKCSILYVLMTSLIPWSVSANESVMLYAAGSLALGVQDQAKTLMMATTTSTDNTGLLDYLIPHFEKETGITLKWTSTGTGKAMALGQNCDVDVLLVHAPAAELAFIEKGYGNDRKEIMYNDFVFIGPEGDPAAVKGKSLTDALAIIQDKQAPFISRGDESGTHKMEQSLWKTAGLSLPDRENWYIQTGQGMLATIVVAQEKKGHTMTDRGTYIKYKAQNDGNPLLKILVEGDKALLNQYSVLTLNPDKCPKSEYDLALQFSDWMASPAGQELIGNFLLMGEKLFFPNAQ